MHIQGIVFYNVYILQVFIFMGYFNCVKSWCLKANKTQQLQIVLFEARVWCYTKLRVPLETEEGNNTTTTYQLLNITSSSEPFKSAYDGNGTIPNIRTKRQSGGGKYAEAAKMGQTKILRLWLQMFANAWSKIYIGGVHPLHREVPKPVVQLFKQRVGEFLFPSLDKQDDD